SSSANQVSVVLGNGNGTFTTHAEFAVGSVPIGVAAGDLNGDTYMDVLVTNVSSATVSVLLGNGDGTLQAKTDYATGTSPFGMALADVDGDGALDLAVANDHSSSVTFRLGNGDGTFGSAQTLAMPFDSPAVLFA